MVSAHCIIQFYVSAMECLRLRGKNETKSNVNKTAEKLQVSAYEWKSLKKGGKNIYKGKKRERGEPTKWLLNLKFWNWLNS